MPETNGVLVIEVVENSPASRAGIKACDLIKSVNGTKVKDASEVQLEVSRGTVGEPMPLILERDTKPVEVSVRPAELPKQ